MIVVEFHSKGNCKLKRKAITYQHGNLLQLEDFNISNCSNEFDGASTSEQAVLIEDVNNGARKS